MAARIPLTIAICLLAGCAGFRPVAPAPQRVHAGEPSAIELPTPIPEGTSLRWDPGDGSAPVEGQVLRHVWQRPGTYQVRVEGSGGDARFEVEVEPRPVLRAIPASVQTAIAIPRAWADFDRWVKLAGRFWPDHEILEGLGRLQERLGADPSDPADLVEVGIDPAEGIGMAVFEWDGGTPWLLVGILDEDKAVATVQRLFALELIDRIDAGAGRFYVGADDEGEVQVFGLVGGYLVVRGSDTTPEDTREIAAAFAEAGAGLAVDPAFEQGRVHAPGGDLVLFVQRHHGDEAFGSMVTAVDLAEDRLVARFGLIPEAGAPEDLGTHVAPAAAMSRFPGEVVAFLSLSVDPVRLWDGMVTEPVQRALFAHTVSQELGVPFDTMLGAFTGNVSVGVYFDAEAFAEVVAGVTGGQPGMDGTPPLIARAQYRDRAGAQVVEQALARVTQATDDGWHQRGPWFFRSAEDHLEVLSLRARHMRPRPRGTTDFSHLLPEEAGVQAFYLDVESILTTLRTSEARSPGAAVVRTLLLEEAGFLEPIRAIRVHGRVVPDGIQGTLHLDLHPPAPNAAERPAVPRRQQPDFGPSL